MCIVKIARLWLLSLYIVSLYCLSIIIVSLYCLSILSLYIVSLYIVSHINRRRILKWCSVTLILRRVYGLRSPVIFGYYGGFCISLKMKTIFTLCLKTYFAFLKRYCRSCFNPVPRSLSFRIPESLPPMYNVISCCTEPCPVGDWSRIRGPTIRWGKSLARKPRAQHRSPTSEVSTHRGVLR